MFPSSLSSFEWINNNINICSRLVHIEKNESDREDMRLHWLYWENSLSFPNRVKLRKRKWVLIVSELFDIALNAFGTEKLVRCNRVLVLAELVSHCISCSLRPIYAERQWLIRSISVNTWVISEQLGLQPISEQLAWFIKKSKQFNHSDITSINVDA